MFTTTEAGRHLRRPVFLIRKMADELKLGRRFGVYRMLSLAEVEAVGRALDARDVRLGRKPGTLEPAANRK